QRRDHCLQPGTFGLSNDFVGFGTSHRPLVAVNKETSVMDSENQETVRPGSRRYAGFVAAAVVAILVVAFVVRRQEARPNETAAAPEPKPAGDVIEATPEQLKQIRVESVRDQMVDLELETTGKVGFNEERLSPVFAPYSGRVLEVLANKGDVVK